MIVFKLLLVATTTVLNIWSGVEAFDWKPFEHGKYTYQKMGKPFTCVFGELVDDDVFLVALHGTGTDLVHKKELMLSIAEEGKEVMTPDTAEEYRCKKAGVKMLKIKENTKGTLVSRDGTLTKKNIPGFLIQVPDDYEEKLASENKRLEKGKK